MDWYWFVPLAYFIISAIFFYFPNILHSKKKYAISILNRVSQIKKILCFAHRGGAFQGPENTIQTFKANANYCNFFQLDVQLTKDKQIVVNHDDTLLRLCGVDKKISDFNYDELPVFLKQYQPYGRDQLMKTSCNKIPLLEDVFKLFPQKYINIQLKYIEEQLIDKVNKLIKKYDRQHLTIWGYGYSQNIILRKINPQIGYICSIKEVVKFSILFLLGLLPFVPLDKAILQIPLLCPQIKKNIRIDQKGFKVYLTIFQYAFLNLIARFFIPHLKKRGILTIFWTLNHEDEYRKAVSYGCVGIITDSPQRLTKWLQKQNLLIRTDEKLD